MQRRSFLKNSLLSSAALTTGATSVLATGDSGPAPARSFKLKYAPHLGMFAQSAGDDPVDQLKFMAEMGFKAFEDNDMRNREVALQEKMAKAMASLSSGMA